MFDIRPIRKSDIDACHKITLQNWDKKTADNFLIEVDHAWSGAPYSPAYYVADNEIGEVIAFAGLMPSFILTGVWDIIWVNVKEGFKKEGIGTRLIRHQINEISQCDGKVIHLMTKSPDYFARFGYHIRKFKPLFG
jgi:predicted N-acetyltransferase YhbS